MKKFSQFNIFLTYNHQFIGYNTFSQEVIAINSFLYELLSSNNKIEELEKIHPDFFDFLIKKGFIIDTKTDEVDKVRDLMQKTDCDEHFYELIINPTMNCNFKCWYCYEEHIVKSSMNPKVQASVANHIKTVLKDTQIKKFHLSWFGGEPLLDYKNTVMPLTKKIMEIAEEKAVCFSSSYTTNGLLINKAMIPFFTKTNAISFQITLDGHQKRHNQVRYISKNKGSYNKIVENIKLLVANNLQVAVRINYSEETIPDLTKIADDFIKSSKAYLNRIRFSFHQVWQVSKDLESPMKDIRDYFSKLGFMVNSSYDIDYVRSSCYADKKNHATINYNGDAYKCTARDFKKDNREGLLNTNGTISWNEKYDKRMHIKLQNKPCLTCSILPVCGGGCTQNYLEGLDKNKEYCLFDFDEGKKKEFIREKVLTYFRNQ